MDKKRLFRIMNRADRDEIIEYASEIQAGYQVMIVKKPEKSLAMVKMREPVKESLFYIGEVIVTDAIVSIGGTTGRAVAMGDDFDKTVAMAIIDAACNYGCFQRENELYDLERKQQERIEKENTMFMKTMVNFNSMDSEAAE
ncbi:MAG: phosphonate C-P lyase system protein PhnG [Ruminococcus sp.]|nr:phosphonate C-P lyase system protein PhnG [Ruminococcus sp.]